MAASKSPRIKENIKNKGARRSVPSDLLISPTSEPNGGRTSRISITDESYESVAFIWFDLYDQMATNIVGPLRTISANVQTFTNSSNCLDAIRSSKEKVFFISSSSNHELIANVHDLHAVEAIFIIDPNGETIKGAYPKLFGVFNQQEELFRVLKEVLACFEQVQLEEFAFEEDKIFLWSQLWKEDLRSRKLSSNKHELIQIAQRYYRDNPRINEVIEEFEKSYRAADAINWCLRSPFPTRLLLHALRSHDKTQLNVCRFLFCDAARCFQQHPKQKSSDQVYRGMKFPSSLLDMFEAHVGQLICTSGFFPCTKSRTHALTLASLPTYRPDLLSVLFKIDCDTLSLFTEISNKQSLPVVAFDICMTFRIVYVNRSQMSVIKLKTAGEAGQKIAAEYSAKHSDQTVQILMDELLKLPKPPTPPLPPKPPRPSPPPAQILTLSSKPKSASALRKSATDSTLITEEMKAQKYAEEGNIDLALITYRRVQPPTVQVLNAMGRLCAERKCDYNYALQCYQQALELQHEAGEYIADTLTNLGDVYQCRDEYDLALDHHKRALELHQTNPTANSAAMASNFLGIAKVYGARLNYVEAILNAEQALTLQEGQVPINESSIATTLAFLGNIYQSSGDKSRALDVYSKAIALLEPIEPKYSLSLAELFYKLGTVQASLEALIDAQRNLGRAVKIYQKLLPRGHPDRIAAETEYQRVKQSCQSSTK